ncbi:nicotinamide N-methyltransferase-like [Lithobates pipiens]
MQNGHRPAIRPLRSLWPTTGYQVDKVALASQKVGHPCCILTTSKEAVFKDRSTEEEKAEKIRRKVSFMKCDVTKSNPLEPNSLPLADCVIIAGCLICASKNDEEFKTVLKNVVSLIRPGGHLIINDYLGASYYLVGEAKFSVLSLDENIVREAVSESGCEIQEFMTFTDLQFQEEVFNSNVSFCLLARKH